jgi:hypothetical protein
MHGIVTALALAFERDRIAIPKPVLGKGFGEKGISPRFPLG